MPVYTHHASLSRYKICSVGYTDLSREYYYCLLTVSFVRLLRLLAIKTHVMARDELACVNSSSAYFDGFYLLIQVEN